MKTLIFILFVSQFSFAGSPEEDPIARNYHERFLAAITPTMEQIYRLKPDRTEERWRGEWIKCHSRSLKKGLFESWGSRYSFSPVTDEILVTDIYSTTRGSEYYLHQGEFQNISNVKLKSDADPEKGVDSLSFDTIRVDLEGNLIIERSLVPVEAAQLKALEVRSAAVGSLEAKVESYTVCRLKDML